MSRQLPDLIPLHLTGIANGIVMLTPDEVSKQTIGKVPFFKPHAEITINIRGEGLKLLHGASYAGSSGKGSLSVYYSDVNFPDECQCPHCLNNVEKRVLIEKAINKRQLGRVTFSSNDAAINQKTATALTCDRYWLEVPFCDNCHAEKQPVEIGGIYDREGNQFVTYKFCNLEYAKRFASLNKAVNSRLITVKHSLISMLGGILTILSIIYAVLSFSECNGQPVLVGVGFLTIPMVIAFIAGIAAFVIGGRGKPF